jgi:hypothetical protein
MPYYLTNAGMWASLWPIFVLSVLLAGVGAAFFGAKGSRIPLLLLLGAFGILGGTTGYLTGISRVPVVGAVIPALLTLVGGLALFEASRNKDQQTIIALIIAILASVLLVATQWGADDRVRADIEHQAYVERDLERHLYRIAVVEQRVNEMRKVLGLPPLDKSDVAPLLARQLKPSPKE